MSKKNYIDNEELLVEVLLHQDKLKEFYATYDSYDDIPKNLRHGIHFMSPKLAKMCDELTRNIAKAVNFRNNPEIEDAVGDAVIVAMKAIKSFKMEFSENNETKKPNPYGYLTCCIQRALAGHIDKEHGRVSKHLDYVIGLVSTENYYDDQTMVNNALKPLIDARKEITGKWSVDTLLSKGRKEAI